MAGNEKDVVKYLFNRIGKIELHHIGKVEKIGVPSGNSTVYLSDIDDLDTLSTEDANKKADVIINESGVSIKQSGASFPFNRLQRAEILDVFEQLNFADPESQLDKIDKEIDNFHYGRIQGRSRPWENLFEENDFYALVKFLMMTGSPNKGISSHKADFILVAPSVGFSEKNIKVFTFDEYFEHFKSNIYFAIRRQWIGQSSDSEHRRAVGLARKSDNQRWVYDSISGQPRVSKKTGKRWRDEITPEDRKTVYMIFVEKV